MNSKDIQFISEAYFEIYEANRGEQYRGLTPKERKIERNEREPAGSALGDLTTKDPLTKRRRFRHQQLRGISPKKRRADNEREYVHYKNEWEKKNPGRSYGDYDDYDDDYDHSPESDSYDNTPRMPGNKPGRRKPLGQNSIRRVQPYLGFSRARAKRKEELSQEREKENQKQREIDQQNNNNKWKTDRAIEDMQRRLSTPRNKIVPFQREEIELILNYLLDEGYVDSFDTAESIFESMSDEWKYKIIEDFKDLTPDKSERVKARHAELVSDIMKNYDEVNRLRKKPFSRHRPGIKRKIRELVGKTKKNATLAQNAGDALIRTSISREAKIKYLKNKISELEPKNKIVPFQREEIELILNYLLDEGYADSFETAELIFENMSYNWSYQILIEKVVSGYNPFPQERVNKQMDRHISRAATFSALEKAYRDTPEGQETPWGRGTVKGSPEMARHARDLYQRSIDRHVDMAMASQYHDPKKVQSRQRVNKIIGDMKRDRARWNEEDAEANKKRQEKYLKYRRSRVHPPSSSDFIPFSNTRKSSSPHHKPDLTSHERPSVSRKSSFKKTSRRRSPHHR